MEDQDILYVEFAMERRHLRGLRALMAVAIDQHTKVNAAHGDKAADPEEIEAFRMLLGNIETQLGE
jgi:hypothetical protein